MASGWLGVVDRRVDPSELGNDIELSRRPFAFMCPKPNCYTAKAAKSREHAEEIRDTHDCPHIGGISHIGGTVTLTLVEQMWAAADLTMQKLDSDSISREQADRLRGELNGMCKMIAIFMPPLFSSAKEIGTELTKRKAMRDSGEEYETPGLGHRRFERPQLAKTAELKGEEAPAQKIPAETVPENVQVGIRKAIESGLFTKDQVAKQFNITLTTVERILVS